MKVNPIVLEKTNKALSANAGLIFLNQLIEQLDFVLIDIIEDVSPYPNIQKLKLVDTSISLNGLLLIFL